LTYDHKGSDTQEAKRIMDAGGFVMNNRVNGTFKYQAIRQDHYRLSSSDIAMLMTRCIGGDKIPWRRIHEGIRSRITIHYRNDPRSIRRILDCSL
jgi:hypothetical protein